MLEHLINKRSPVKEPYEYIKDGNVTAGKSGISPDPLYGYRWEAPRAEDDLQIFCMTPVSAKTENPSAFLEYNTLTEESPQMTVCGTGTVLLDFGTEAAGWLEVDIPDLTGEITLGISEYNMPAFVNVGPQSPSKTAVPVRYGNTYRLELNDELYEGVRFGFIHVERVDRPFRITGVRLVCQVKPVNYNSSFHSDNAMLDRIWYTAAYDVRVNLKKDYFAAILIDRGDRYSWTGDAYPAQAAALTAFGNYDFVLHNLHYTSQRSNGIESYELYWVESLIDYYYYSGDTDGVRGLLEQAFLRLDHAYDIYDSDVNLVFFGWDERLGAGFENPNHFETRTAYRVTAIGAWKHFAEVLEELGETAAAEKYRHYAAEKTAMLYKEPDWWRACGVHAASDAIIAGVLTPDRIETVSETYYTDRVKRLSYSPFNQYFILKAMAAAGRYEEAVTAVLDLWGGQIEYGGSAFFETYRPCWNPLTGRNGPVPNNQAGYTSLAHPWSAGVLSWMQEELLGVKPVRAGFRRFAVKPHLGSRLNFVSGETYTPYGTIFASFDKIKGVSRLVVPEKTVCDLAIPVAGCKVCAVSCNDRTVCPDSQSEDFLYFNGLTAGTYEFVISYTEENGKTPAYIPEPVFWHAELLNTDRETAGKWNGKYGRDGFLLCGYNGERLAQLPSYVDSVTTGNVYVDTVEESTLTGTRLPEIERCRSEFCSAGVWRSGNNIACKQTFTADIALSEERPFPVALYFADWNTQERVQAVELFDLKTKELLAPVAWVSDFAEGVYLVYCCPGSVRFRIDQVRGENAVLSGIFFGEPQ